MNQNFDRTAPWHQIDASNGTRYLAYAENPTASGKPLPVMLYGFIDNAFTPIGLSSIDPNGTVQLPGNLQEAVSGSGRIAIMGTNAKIRIARSYEEASESETYSASPHAFLNSTSSSDNLDEYDAEDDVINARENTLGDAFCRL